MADGRFPGEFARPVAVGAGSDTVVGPYVGFMCSGAGDVTVATKDADGAPANVLVGGCLAGIQYYMPCDKIMATGTTATGITGFVR